MKVTHTNLSVRSRQFDLAAAQVIPAQVFFESQIPCTAAASNSKRSCLLETTSFFFDQLFLYIYHTSEGSSGSLLER